MGMWQITFDDKTKSIKLMAFVYWLGATSKQSMAWFNVDPDLCRYMASLGHNEWDVTRDLQLVH